VLRGSAEVAGAIAQRTGREIRKQAVATGKAYQEGKSGEVVNNGIIQRRINNASRRSGRGVAHTKVRLQNHAKATKTAYQEGKSDQITDNGKIQRSINSLSRRSGRNLARAMTNIRDGR